MKRLFALFFTLSLFFVMIPVSASEPVAQEIKIFFLGEQLDVPVAPQKMNHIVMVPMRAIYEAAGYFVDWNAKTRTATATNEYGTISISIGASEANVRGTPRPLEAPAIIVDSSTLVPLSFMPADADYIINYTPNQSIRIEYTAWKKSEISKKKDGYITDLQTIKNTFPGLHPNLFLHLSKESFNKEMDALIGDVPSLTDLEINYRLLKLINSLGDTQTTYDMRKTYAHPLVFFEFSDGIYLMDAPGNFRDFVGKRLTAIGGIPVATVLKKLSPIVPSQNESWAKYTVCGYLNNATYLKMAGVLRSEFETISYSFGNKTLTTTYRNEYLPFTSGLEDIPVRYPQCYESMLTNYWYNVLDDGKTVYAKYNYCFDRNGYLFADFTKDIFNEVKKGADTIILDMRDNLSGGNSSLIKPFVDELMKNKTINKRGHFYVIVGRKTFSAGIQNVMQLKQSTNAVFVGESTGGSPNYYTTFKSLTLPNFGGSIRYYTQYSKSASQNVLTFKPDIAVALKASSFFTGKDDFLSAVLADKLKNK